MGIENLSALTEGTEKSLSTKSSKGGSKKLIEINLKKPKSSKSKK